MILDTTYILPAAEIDIGPRDLLSYIYEGKAVISMHEIKINTISLFELQMVAAKKYHVSPKIVGNAINALVNKVAMVPFYSTDIIQIADALSERIKDYFDCIILATAIATNEELVTEDRKILDAREALKREYGITITDYDELLNRS